MAAQTCLGLCVPSGGLKLSFRPKEQSHLGVSGFSRGHLLSRDTEGHCLQDVGKTKHTRVRVSLSHAWVSSELKITLETPKRVRSEP